MGGRVFDYLGLVILLLIIALSIIFDVKFNGIKSLGKFLIVNGVIWGLYGAIGILRGNLTTSGAFLLGAFVVFPLFYCYALEDGRRLGQTLTLLMLVNLSFFFLQYLSFKVAGRLVIYHNLPGVIPPRIYNEGLDFFRAAGLSQEANSYSVVTFLLLTARRLITNKSFDTLSILALLSILFCESLWGLFGIFVYLFFFSKFKLVKVGILVTPVIVGSLILTSPTVFQGVVSAVTLDRLANIQDDPSANDRLGLEQNQSAGLSLSSLIGEGISISEFGEKKGVNAISFYITSFGLIGLLFFLGGLYFLPKQNKLFLLVAVAYLMTTYPYFTYMIWWAWLGIVLSESLSKNEDIKPQRVLEGSL